jgi:hypothetical protein
MQYLPAAGEIVIFDRSWYNRAGVEYVMGFCSNDQHKRFLQFCPSVEKFVPELSSDGRKLGTCLAKRHHPHKSSTRSCADRMRKTIVSG